jgi:hypothetical protein
VKEIVWPLFGVGKYENKKLPASPRCAQLQRRPEIVRSDYEICRSGYRYTFCFID